MGKPPDMMVEITVESGVGAHIDDATLAWVDDAGWWGLCGMGHDEGSAVADLHRRALPARRAFMQRHGVSCPPFDGAEVVERLHGDEQAFDRDHRPASPEEFDATIRILGWARQELTELIAHAREDELDHDDPARVLPSWASWRTLRQMAWHVTDTESRYYLAALDVPPPPRAGNLHEELARSHSHVLAALGELDPAQVNEPGGEVWTTRKVLRRLAWHEPSELDAMVRLLRRARRDLGRS